MWAFDVRPLVDAYLWTNILMYITACVSTKDEHTFGFVGLPDLHRVDGGEMISQLGKDLLNIFSVEKSLSEFLNLCSILDIFALRSARLLPSIQSEKAF